MDAGALGAAKERPDVVRILERVEDEHERRLAALGGAGEDVVDGGEPTRLDDEGDALVTIEAGERRQRPAFDLDDRDPQARGVQDDLLERLPALRDDEQPAGRPPGDERLLDRPASGDEFLIGGQGVRWRQPGPAGRAHGTAGRSRHPGRAGTAGADPDGAGRPGRAVRRAIVGSRDAAGRRRTGAGR